MNKKAVNYIQYNDQWPKIFNTEKKRLLDGINNNVIIEHIGSTAIPGMPGKGVIDILIVTDNKLGLVAQQLQEIGLVPRDNAGTANRIFFSDKPLESPDVKFHYHLVLSGTNDHLSPIKFRDYLISHTEEAKEYANLKRTLSGSVSKSRDYLEGKSEFINRIISKC
jgi:GrpB-like predicted nucleotidyltransferase (UPF0157 family)